MSIAVYTTPYAPTPRIPVSSNQSAKTRPSRSCGALSPDSSGEGGGVGNMADRVWSPGTKRDVSSPGLIAKTKECPGLLETVGRALNGTERSTSDYESE